MTLIQKSWSIRSCSDLKNVTYLFVLETDYQNLRQLWDQFLPTSGPFSAMGYLDAKLLRFQRLFCRIWDFFILLSCGDIIKSVKNVIFGNFRFCKKKKFFFKKIRQMAADVKIAMDGDGKKSLKIAIIEFYKLNSSKGHPQNESL